MNIDHNILKISGKMKGFHEGDTYVYFVVFQENMNA
jgi:hypothetical protein